MQDDNSNHTIEKDDNMQINITIQNIHNNNTNPHFQG